MARILFVVSSDSGQINPCVGPAWYLQEEGHEVAFFAPKDISEQLSRAELKQAFCTDEVAPVRLDAARSARLAQNLKDREWARLWMRSVMIDSLEDRIITLSKVCDDFQPDALVVYATCYEGAVVAHARGIPWAGLTTSLNPFVPDLLAADLHEVCKGWSKERDQIMARYAGSTQFSFRLTEVVSPHLNMSLTTNELIGHRGNPEYKRVGPSIAPRDRGDETDFPWDKVRDNVPLVYMSLGADTYNQPESLTRVFSAVKDRKVQLVVYAGTLADDPSALGAEIPANVLLCNYVPQLTVLAGSSAFITHGGATSVMEAIYFGVPMLVSPLWSDHPHQAFFVDKEGGGVRCEIPKTTPNALWKQLESLLQFKKYKEGIERLQLSYKRNEGASDIARLIDQLVDKARV